MKKIDRFPQVHCPLCNKVAKGYKKYDGFKWFHHCEHKHEVAYSINGVYHDFTMPLEFDERGYITTNHGLMLLSYPNEK